MNEKARPPRWLAVLVNTSPAQPTVDAAMVVVRVALAWVFLYYGAGKLFGWWHGPGLDVSADFFANTAHLRPGRFFAVLGGVMEFGGAIAVALGLGVRLVGIALFADMVLAMALVTWTNGIDTAKVPPGYELNLALAALALMLALLGAGRFSADALVERRFRTPQG